MVFHLETGVVYSGCGMWGTGNRELSFSGKQTVLDFCVTRAIPVFISKGWTLGTKQDLG